ncbi:MAG: hypothetical protein U9N54_09545, partial [candidate division Zixibacteria bacterium]|nr:hypothetical protein [candidate division Zixibacteria bacterium]
MEEAYIVSDYKPFIKGVIEQLIFSEDHIFSLPTFENESQIHDWITHLFKENKIEKLIIPVSIPTDNPINTEGLKIALHIRLNYELSINQRLIPIILLSDFNAEVILRKNNFDSDNNPQNLLFTKGIYLSTFDTEEIKNTIEVAEPCLPKDYHIQVLNKLKILQKASTGKHSIVNAWGCFKLAQVAGLREEIFSHNAISLYLKTLYAKYLICYNDTFKQDVFIDLKPIKCGKKKILFIDDQADEGWAVLMKSIFKSAGSDFVSIDSAKYKNKETKLFHDFDGFYSECQSHIGKVWDLIIIDLRLNPEKEDIDNEMMKPIEFSGYKLIDEYLKANEGYQIIISTASNKIWNINAALERGVSSYYIKESPEFNYSISETKKHFYNFKNDVQKCFKRSYLRDIYKDNQQLFLNLNSNSPSNFVNEIKNQLPLAYSLLNDAKTDIQFAYAYISLYMIIEIINNEYYTKTSDDKWEILGVGNLLDWKW